ncbi:Surfeit locus protein 1 [Eufriesea mexicana]|nr:Surfeit locus protein 1 [Eufriesea mexicana]
MCPVLRERMEIKDPVVNVTVFGIPICAFVLGTWQIQRLKWKLDLLERLNSRINQEPIELPEDLEDLESKEYYPIKVRGTFLHDKEFMAGYRSLIVDGKPLDRPMFGLNKDARGYHIITPFKLADRDLTILVNRGWVPKMHKNPQTRQEGQIDGETEIVGILRLNERRPSFVPKNRPNRNMWYYRDVYQMSEKGGTSPIYLEAVVEDKSYKYPVGGQTRVELRNEHFSYILTWYSLSLITSYLWYRKFVKGIPVTA